MSVNAMNNVMATTDTYAAYGASKAETTPKKENTTEAPKKEVSEGVVYEKSDNDKKDKAPYKVNKMSAEERSALVQRLKADQENRQSQLVNLVKKMFTEQTTSFANANDMWKLLAKGNFEVDAQTKLQAQQDIAEGGYYSVEKTAERLFDFASALAGDDVDKMKEMQAAMKKGFDQATAAWGKELPDISQRTLDTANKMFEDYYASKGAATVE